MKLLETNEVAHVPPHMARYTKNSKKRSKAFGKRAARRLPALVIVQGVAYEGPSVEGGDFYHMIQDPRYKDAIFVFNDNVHDYTDSVLMPLATQNPGGGNAIVRPWQVRGDARGVPTGPFFSTLYTVLDGGTAKGWIDSGIDQLVLTFVNNPSKKRLIYSVESKGSRMLGVGIFKHQVGDDVRAYITDQIHAVPKLVREARERM